jgi:hypothetical protein
VVDADVTDTSFHRAIELMIKAADKGYSHEGEEEKARTKPKFIVPLCEKLLSPPDWITAFTRAKENA